MSSNNGKTANKTAKPSGRNGNVLPLGNHPGNTGGKPGRSGRPRKVWKEFLADLRQDPDVQDAVERGAKDETSKGFKPALGVMERYDPERPSLKVDVGLGEHLLVLVQQGRKRVANER